MQRRAITPSTAAPSSLLAHWIILASSSLISLEHHLSVLFLGYYLQERGPYFPVSDVCVFVGGQQRLFDEGEKVKV